MRIFFTDLDNTLIYSYKRDIGDAKRCVEVYQGREISFMTEKAHRLLKKIRKRALIIPVTTRTVEQYNRIDLGIGAPAYALACNGGVLLADGREDAPWFLESQQLVAGCTGHLAFAKELMQKDNNRCFEVRDIRGLFLFTKSENPIESAEYLRASLDKGLVDVFCNGLKVYVVPKALNKGMAVKRFCKRVSPGAVVAAGDSAFDVPMVKEADAGIVPEGIFKMVEGCGKVTYVPEGQLFSDKLLEKVNDVLAECI